MALVRPLISAQHHHCHHYHCPFPSNEINTRDGEWSLRRLTSIQMVLVHDPQLSPTDPYSLYIPNGTNRGHPWWSSRLTSTDSALSPPLPPSNVFPLLQMRRTHWNIWKCDKHEATTEPSLPWLIPFPYPASTPAHPTFTRGNHLIAPLLHLPRHLLHLSRQAQPSPQFPSHTPS